MPNEQPPVGVLVVDDEPRIREALTRVLGPMGFETATAGRGKEAFDILSQKEIDIVLLDLKLPDVNGMDVLRTIRERHPRIVVIIITGFGSVQTAAEAMRNGAYDLLPKPFEPDQLRIAINRALEKMRLERATRQLEQERQRTLSDLSLEKSRIHTIINALPIGVMVTDTRGEVVLLNPAFAQYMELPAGTCAGQTLAAYVHDEGLRRLVMEFSQGCHVDANDSPTYEFSVGEDKYLFARGKPVLSAQGQCLGAVVTIVDITAMKALDRL
ncbi:MAG: response regulator, partial [Hydrogenophaga sp.]|nr:response regulator [Hydrogenophaga sp.]